MSAHEAATPLFPDEANPTAEQRHSTGIVPSQGLRELVQSKALRAATPIAEAQIQPASLDLRLGPVAYRVRASFLPGAEHTVREKIDAFAMHEIDLSKGAVLERGCVYIVPLEEHVAFGWRVSAIANPKSSIGRLDIFVRLITDHAIEFDRVREQYKGPLYAEIAPRTFSILVRQGSRLNQLRVRRGSPAATDTALKRLHSEVGLVHGGPGEENIRHGIAVTVDFRGDPQTRLLGFKAKRHTPLIDVDRVSHYDPLEFWEPIYARADRGIILNPDDFYILASKEAVTVPPDHAAEMVAYDTLVGEFRVHYAGFFDPGFGYDPQGGGTKAVLEVRSHEVPFVVEEGQIVGRLVYERLTAEPDKLYGPDIGSSYQRQGLKLGKQFRALER